MSGTVLPGSPDSIRVRNDAGRLFVIPRKDIAGMQVPDGRGRATWRGAWTGLVVGMAVGGLVAAPIELCIYTACGSAAPLGAIVGIPVGFIAGVIVGSSTQVQRWRRVDRRDLHISLHPRRGGVALGVSVGL